MPGSLLPVPCAGTLPLRHAVQGVGRKRSGAKGKRYTGTGMGFPKGKGASSSPSPLVRFLPPFFCANKRMGPSERPAAMVCRKPRHKGARRRNCPLGEPGSSGLPQATAKRTSAGETAPPESPVLSDLPQTCSKKPGRAEECLRTAWFL